MTDEDKHRAEDYQGEKDGIAADRTAWQQEWTAIKAAYTEQMGLKGPVQYWKDRSAEHRDNASVGSTRAWQLGIGGLVVGLAVSLTAFALSPSIISWVFGLSDLGWHVQVGVGAGATVAYFTLYLWVMRIAIRLFMTEHHLAIDAGTRARMAETYLALIAEGGAGKEDRAIVLGSLFKPVSDGIVKDDAMPLMSPSAWLSQIVGGRS